MNQPIPTYSPTDQVIPPIAQPVKPKKQPSGWAKLWGAFGLGVATYAILIVVELVFIFVGDRSIDLSNEQLAVCELVGGIVALLFIVVLGGKNIARPSLKGMGTAWKAAIWLFAADGLFVVMEIIEVVFGFEQIEIASDWPVRVGILALLCFGIGLFEETTMRGLCLNGLLARMGRTRAGVYGAAILSSLFFGLLHFDPFVGFDDPLSVAQNCMKVVQSGMVGYLLAAILINTRNIWAVAIIHGANDFMLLFISNGLTNETVTTNYVQSGDDGMVVLGLYIVLCVLYLPFLFIGRRLIREASPWRGDFYHYGEPGSTRIAGSPAPMATSQPVQAVPIPGYPVATRVYAPTSSTPAQAAPAQPAAAPTTSAAPVVRSSGPRHAAPPASRRTEEERQARAALADRLPRI